MVVSMPITDFLVDRADISKSKIEERPFPELDDGDVLLEIERFGLSANNITYAVLGDAMGYWKFFPVPDGFGSVPVWGHANVVESNSDQISVGARYFGYYPMSTHLVVRPTRVRSGGFFDGAVHRAELPAVYQRYMRVGDQILPGSPDEDQLALWRPLFTTSFGVADFVDANDAFGAETAVLTSASSKTALAAAFSLKHLASELELVGLTSASNVEFCEETGYYDRAVSYDTIDRLGDTSLLVIDFAGNDATLEAIEELAGEKLKRTVIVGVTHWQGREGSLTEVLPGREFFYLPTWFEKRRLDWGASEFFKRSDRVWELFAPTVTNWLQIEEHTGTDGIDAAYQSVLSGESRPDVGHILQF